jgi:hypothetical protein
MSKFVDPLTGDTLTRSERVMWALMGTIRHPLFLVAFVAYTAESFVTGKIWHADQLTIWNLVASALAIVVEQVVGRTVWNQGRRDAVILRHIEKLVAHIESIEMEKSSNDQP